MKQYICMILLDDTGTPEWPALRSSFKWQYFWFCKMITDRNLLDTLIHFNTSPCPICYTWYDMHVLLLIFVRSHLWKYSIIINVWKSIKNARWLPLKKEIKKWWQKICILFVSIRAIACSTLIFIIYWHYFSAIYRSNHQSISFHYIWYLVENVEMHGRNTHFGYNVRWQSGPC
jgi:hypothetical protein